VIPNDPADRSRAGGAPSDHSPSAPNPHDDELPSLDSWLADFESPIPTASKIVDIKRRIDIEIGMEWLSETSADPALDDGIRTRIKLVVRRQLSAESAPNRRVVASAGPIRASVPLLPLASAALLGFFLLSALVGPRAHRAPSIGPVDDPWIAGPMEGAFQADAAAITNLDFDLAGLENALMYDSTGTVTDRLYEELTGAIEDTVEKLESIADVI